MDERGEVSAELYTVVGAQSAGHSSSSIGTGGAAAAVLVVAVIPQPPRGLLLPLAPSDDHLQLCSAQHPT
jgi:hypothetical protein